MWRNLKRIIKGSSFRNTSDFSSRAICNHINHRLTPKTRFIEDVIKMSIIPAKIRNLVKHFKALNSYENGADLVINGELSTQDVQYFEHYEIELILADVYGLNRICVDRDSNKELQESRSASEVNTVLIKKDINLGSADCLLALRKLVAFDLENVSSGTVNAKVPYVHDHLNQSIVRRIGNVYEEMSCSDLISCLLGFYHLQVSCNNEVVAKILRQLKSMMSAGKLINCFTA